MDLVLEVCDTLLFDRVYTKLFPKSQNWPLWLVNALGLSTIITPQNANLIKGATIFDSIKGNDTTGAGSFSFSQIMQVSTQHVYGHQPFLMTPTHYALGSLFDRTNVLRQLISLTLIITVFGFLLYILTAGLSYVFVYDKETMKHPKFLKNQIRMEIKLALSAIPFMSLLTAVCFVFELAGYSKLYWDLDEYPRWYLWFQYPLFIMFTDFGVYLIHRGLHHRVLYKTLHKPHHKWIVSTPFASHAFHPVDGFLQSLPYHIFPFVFPLQKLSYILLFIIVNVWTVMIHDGEYLARDPIINGAACHTVHHLYFNYNYGQYTSLWDRIGGSYRKPDPELYDKKLKNEQSTWKAQSRKMEIIVKEVEEGDDRVYLNSDKKND
ncbi:hypothetical protein D0Z03_002716 [Geotrichum reessii]|nr:hypothetical protein D0Z03_002716 [Galactomyces reessii]